MLDVDLEASVDELEQQLLAREALIGALRLQQAEALRTLDAGQVHRLDGSRSLPGPEKAPIGRLRVRVAVY